MGGDFDGDRVSVHLSVSVPLRGKGRDQPNKRPVLAVLHTQFPSPCGEKVGINPPLLLRPRRVHNIPVSVPLRGKGRDQPQKHNIEAEIDGRFRPLAGKR